MTDWSNTQRRATVWRCAMVEYNRGYAYVSSESISNVVLGENSVSFVINGKNYLIPIDRLYKTAKGRFLNVECHIDVGEDEDARIDLNLRFIEKDKIDITAKSISESVGSQDFHDLFFF